MKVLVLGGNGMLGHKLVQVLQNRYEVWTTLRSSVDRFKYLKLFDPAKTFEFTDAFDSKKIEEILSILKPEVVINAVGVIKQLPDSKDVVNTLTINSIFPQKLSQIAAKINFRLINISTDCVFNGKNGGYTEDDVSDAVDLYGKSKNFGEVTGANCLTLRTSIIGREIETKHSLIEWFISNRGGTVKGFKNAVYTGLPTIILAGIIGDLIEKFPGLQGLYHLSGEPINKFDLLSLVNDTYRLGITIEEDEDFIIDRSLDSSKFRAVTGFTPQSWEDMIKIMADDPTPYDLWRRRASI